MQKKIISYLFFLLIVSFTHSFAQSPSVNPYPAGPYPDRIFLNITEDASTSMAASWRTGVEVVENFLEIMPATDTPSNIKNAMSHKAFTEPFELDHVQANYHSVKVKDLQPNTLYMYRVGAGNYWSEWFHIKTAGKPGEKFSFIYMGDVQVGMRTLWPRVIREAYKRVPDARLIMYAGDIVNRGFNDHEWGELFDGGSFIHSTIPGLPSPGNHEHADNAEGINIITPLWRQQFALPDNGPEGLEETCYYADVQGVRFISLNSQAIWFGGEMMRRQMDWLHKILGNNPNKWTCVTFHHPVYSVKSNRDNKDLREKFQPIFDQYKVDLVLQGHDHAYGRGMKNIPMPDKKGSSGTMYVVSMAGSKMYDENKQDWMDKSAGHVQLYQVITVDGDRLSYNSYTASGKLFDAFDLIKQKGKINKMVERSK
ncbi:MAG: metallophosphoesterase family protein [Chitinophagaceae bacterium]|nr:metallophosphoesterase family protein [Chitinophagaceae bacterium]